MRQGLFLRTRPACMLRLLLLASLAAVAACGHKAKVSAPAPSAPPEAPRPPAASEPAPEPVAPAPTNPPAGPPPISADPAIRIGISTKSAKVQISAPGDFYLLEKAPEAQRFVVRGPIEIRVEKGRGQRSAVFQVQIASLSRRKAAEELRQAVASRFGQPAAVRETDEGRFQVRVGEFESKEAAREFTDGVLKGAGYPDAFVVQQTLADAGAATLALRGPGGLFRLSSAGYLLFPLSETEFLRLEGRPYRGFFDLALSRTGSITVANQLGLEQYLLGVVASEMSPATYPAPAALAAQAIAARTFALRNMGRYKDDGFDLTDDTRTQVYGGVAAEREPSSEAVRNTFGLAIYYQGQFIDAMYTSTCGGRTEDFAEVFETAPVPYLVGVICAVESEGLKSLQSSIHGEHALDHPVVSSDGRTANRDIELALILGLINPLPPDPEWLEVPAQAHEVRSWVGATEKAARRNRPKSWAEEGSITSRSAFVRYATESVIGGLEISRTVSPVDAGYYLANLKDGASVPEADRIALAFALQKGLWSANPDNTFSPAEAVSRKDAVAFLMRLLLFARPETLASATLTGLLAQDSEGDRDPAITVKWGRQTRTLKLSRQVRLFQRGGERSTAADSLMLIGNERLSLHLDSAGDVDFLEVELNPTGAASDRFSPAATWQTTLTRAQISDKLAPLLADNIGEITDLEPERFGTSGRVVRLRVVGSRSSRVLNGYRVRGALGLRDTLFTIRRVRGPDGRIDSFTFDGRGYGHGIGLCQVGAYGMARAGRSFEEILKAYYTGVEISRAY
jgi:stage II sporulation protein D